MLIMKLKHLILIPIVACAFSGLKAKEIRLDHPEIKVEGAPYLIRTPDKLLFNRFSPRMFSLPEAERMFPARTAASTSGVVFSFRTGSPSIQMKFELQAGLAENSVFKILRNGLDYRILSYPSKEIAKGVTIHLDSLPDTGAATYQIIMPSYSNLALTGLSLDDDFDLMTAEPSAKKVYISFGDSITHGRGQDGASFLTYPFILSRKLGMSLYNQAVGNAKVSVPLAGESNKLPSADLITILIGYNDLNGAGRTAAQYESDYQKYLEEIRKNHPRAKIYCITLLYTKKVKSAKTGHTPEEFRDVVRRVYANMSKTDPRLFLIEGEDVSSAENLQPGADTDAVHLTVKGAGMLAEALFSKLK